MSDALDLGALARQAREFTHAIGERVFTLRMPTQTEVRQAVHRERLMHDPGPLTMMLIYQALLRPALVGWTGVRARDVVLGGIEGEAGAAPLAWSTEHAGLYIDANPWDADALGALLYERTQARLQRVEDDAKN